MGGRKERRRQDMAEVKLCQGNPRKPTAEGGE